MAVFSLRYPNGRTHQVELERPLTCGEEFVLYGRRWRVIGHEDRHATPMRYRRTNPLVCVPLSPSPLAVT